MSRIGKKLIELPNDISVNITDEKVYIKKENIILEQSILPFVKIILNNNKLSISRISDSKFAYSYYGLIRTLIQNMILGLKSGFTKILIIEGVGYKFQITNNTLIIYAGYTHPVELKILNDLSLELESPTRLKISGINKEQVGLFSAEIRKIKPPEPYKGKGIRYENEIIKRKVGKTGK